MPYPHHRANEVCDGGDERWVVVVGRDGGVGSSSGEFRWKGTVVGGNSRVQWWGKVEKGNQGRNEISSGIYI